MRTSGRITLEQVLLSTLIIVLFSTVALAQSAPQKASVFGRIVDRFDQGIADEPVMLINKRNSQSATVKTDPRGWFRFDQVPIEEHTLRVRNQDLAPVVIRNSPGLQIVPIPSPGQANVETRWWVSSLKDIAIVTLKRPDLKVLAIIAGAILEKYGIPAVRVNALFVYA